MFATESILDRSQDDLDGFVWERNADGEYHLSETAKYKIFDILKWVMNTFNLSDIGANITGSITSNQYTDDSDIDLHIITTHVNEQNRDEMNRMLRLKYETEYKISNEDNTYIANHPIELYFQINSHQDMMSIGCYDVLAGKWRNGPTFKEMDFDPFSEYYEDDMKFIRKVIGDVRNVVLECYEIAFVICNSIDKDFKQYQTNRLLGKLEYASSLFTKLANIRKVTSAPQTDEDAIKMRNSIEWKVADSSFKLLDKFGYLKILKECQLIVDEIKNNGGSYAGTDIAHRIIDVIKNTLGNCSDFNVDDIEYIKQLDESFGGKLGLFSLIASMLAVPQMSNLRELQHELGSLPEKELNIGSNGVKDAYNDTFKDNEMIGNLSFANTVNLIATIIYNEAMIDYKKYNDVRCLIAIANVIGNRAGGKPSNFVDVITKPRQFYSAKHIVGGTTDDTFKLYFPYGGNIKCWKLCEEIAVKLVKGNLKNVIGNRNMIANAKLDNEVDFEKWGKNADLKIGSHTFGYDRSQDGYRHSRTHSNKVGKYVVKSGDTLSSISKKNGTTIEDILKKNPDLKDPNKLSKNQTLNI